MRRKIWAVNYNQHIVFFTGAGMSVESGIPTYRGTGGVWKEYNYREYACQEAFERDPEKVWNFHDQRRQKIADCRPNRGHEIIAGTEKLFSRITVITQNIDGLHQRTGSTKVIELHGSIWRLYCRPTGRLIENFELPLENRCCHGEHYWRPDIVWFGDPLREENIREAVAAMESCDLFISIGTSAVVYPAAHLPLIAMKNGARTIEINPEETPLSSEYQEIYRQSASKALAEIFPEIR